MADWRGTLKAIEIPDEQEQPNQSKFNINCLPDSLLVEVLQRVPTCQSAQHCKCVCKRWLSLIADTCFITCFVNHHRYVSNRRPTSRTFTLLHQYRYFAYHDIEPDPKVTLTTHPVHTRVDSIRSDWSFDLRFLTFGQTADIVAVSQDLVVCYDRMLSFQLLQQGKGTNFYVCNLLTKEWISLPPTPSSYWRSGLVGFITYTVDHPCETAVGEFMCSYKLVHVPEAEEFCVEIFSSETGEWSKSVALTPLRPDIRENSITNAVTFRRKLHWVINKNSILALDPFNGDNQYHLIDLPNLGDQTKEFECFGVCKHHLRVSLLVHANKEHRVIVWDLKDYNAGKWSLKHNFCLDDMEVVSSGYSLDQQLNFAEGTCLLALDPNNEAVLYLRHKNCILMCNVQEKTLQVISECRRSWTFHLRNERDTAYMLEQPYWPTPIPPLQRSKASNSD